MQPASPTARIGLFDLTPESLRTILADFDQPAYRTNQMLKWVYERMAGSFDEMTDLPKAFRQLLADQWQLYESEIVHHGESSDGTQKLLLRWTDGATSECVLIPDGDRRTACISTQVGCPVGCVFCASGLDGLQRQLSAGQIVEQGMRIGQLCEPGSRLSNIVFMGLGEPLANYDATVAALRTINSEWGLAIGARKITVSTVGLPKQMIRLAGEGMQITLALSVHAPNDELRQQIIPWAEGVSLDALIDAANQYFNKTGREITLEYILLGGLNDQRPHAEQLARLAKRMRSNVNLIRYNPVPDLPFRRPELDDALNFLDTLKLLGVNAHMRKSRGLDIDAACGQLRRRQSESRPENVVLKVKPPPVD
jgi:23S rRNA (adenine2503-C2)-methyltransferase